jgi:hypothetical protein
MPEKSEQNGGPVIPGRPVKRPPPPADLEPREKVIWRDLAKSLPPDWFATSQTTLKELVQHIALSRDTIADVRRAQAAVDAVRAMPEPSTKLLLAALREKRAALRAHVLQTGQIASLSTKLRLTPQSRWQPATAKVRAGEESTGVELWDDWSNDPGPDDPKLQ